MTCSSAATYAECVIVERDLADYAAADALGAGRSLEYPGHIKKSNKPTPYNPGHIISGLTGAVHELLLHLQHVPGGLYHGVGVEAH